MTVKIELYYSPICPYRPEAKRVLLEILEETSQEFQVEEINVFSPRGLERAKTYGILSVPTIILNSKHKIVGIPEKEDLLRKIKTENNA